MTPNLANRSWFAFQEPADALAADDLSGSRGIGWRLDEPPVEALVVALGVGVGDPFRSVS